MVTQHVYKTRVIERTLLSHITIKILYIKLISYPDLQLEVVVKRNIEVMETIIE